ncbi:MAG: hypothetical protein KF814_02040 [Nitrospiraceae bacterium]|nr:hypothetical protein [Nitrospiraceae bacterium]
MHFTNPDTHKAGFVRFAVFENWDLLVELHQPSTVKKLLQVHSPIVSAYFGLTEEELSSPAKNPFMMIGYGLAPALGPLMSAFPGGIEQIPYTETNFATTYERKSFQGTVVRTSVDALKYDITMSESGGERSFRCYGTWKGTKASSLPDEFSFRDWRFQPDSAAEKQSAQTLGELRKSGDHSATASPTQNQ